MKKIPVEKIEDGMILSKPLIGAAGNVLLNEGVVLKISMVARLKNWGVPFVSVQGEEEAAKQESAPAAQEVHSQKLDQTFAGLLDNPIMKIIYEATLHHLQGKQDADA